MAEASRTSTGFAERGDNGKVSLYEGQKNKLRDTLPLLHRIRGGSRVQEKNGDLAPVVRINESDPLRDRDALYRAESAAGKDKAGHAGFKRLDGQTAADAATPAGRNGYLRGIRRAGSQVNARRARGGGSEALVAVQRCGIAKKAHMNRGLL